MRRKNKTLEFIDNKRYFLEWENFKVGQDIFYKRLSDEEDSHGTIKWFEISKEGKIIVTLIDNVLKNFQACYFSDIIEKPQKSLVEKIRKKI